MQITSSGIDNATDSGSGRVNHFIAILKRIHSEVPWSKADKCWILRQPLIEISLPKGGKLLWGVPMKPPTCVVYAPRNVNYKTRWSPVKWNREYCADHWPLIVGLEGLSSRIYFSQFKLCSGTAIRLFVGCPRKKKFYRLKQKPYLETASPELTLY